MSAKPPLRVSQGVSVFGPNDGPTARYIRLDWRNRAGEPSEAAAAAVGIDLQSDAVLGAALLSATLSIAATNNVYAVLGTSDAITASLFPTVPADAFPACGEPNFQSASITDSGATLALIQHAFGEGSLRVADAGSTVDVLPDISSALPDAAQAITSAGPLSVSDIRSQLDAGGDNVSAVPIIVLGNVSIASFDTPLTLTTGTAAEFLGDGNVAGVVHLVDNANVSLDALSETGPQNNTILPITTTEAPGTGDFAAGEGNTIAVDLHGIAVSVPLSLSTPGAVDLASLANPVAGSFAAAITDSGIGSNGATRAQVQEALDESGSLSVDGGAGIRVGVLSDSFNDLGGAAADEKDGALPPAADIDVIEDLASGGTDEGRAMMQIIHDIAPGADLAFYTAFDSEQDFANGILALAAAGCKVIVDDVSYYDEPFFQNGVVAQAIQTVEAEGVTYITAAGNDASNGYQAAWTSISGTYHGTKLTDAESFGGSLVQTVTINTEGTGYDVPLLLEWNQAYGHATSDLEILVFNSHGQLIGTATNASDGEPTNPWVEFDFSQTGTYYVAIENLSRSNPSLIKEILEGDGLPATFGVDNVGTVYGHAMTPGAITAGAVSTADTPAFGVNPPTSESYSSSGAGTELLFANNGTALSSPDVLSPVAVSGVDDINTTVSGGLSDFFGTSAAAASIAGVAALILSANPNLTPAEVDQILQASALAMANPAVSGAGLVQADVAVADADVDYISVSSGQTLNIASGDTGLGDIVLSSGTLSVLSGGTASGTIIDSGGTEIVAVGGTTGTGGGGAAVAPNSDATFIDGGTLILK
ncbi:MAG: S8 family serine peptidase, partial [Thermoguttaceae bacterium]